MQIYYEEEEEGEKANSEKVFQIIKYWVCRRVRLHSRYKRICFVAEIEIMYTVVITDRYENLAVPIFWMSSNRSNWCSVST